MKLIKIFSVGISVFIILTVVNTSKAKWLYEKYSSLNTIKNVTESDVKPLHIYTISISEGDFILIEYPMPSWFTFRSGPSAFAYDKYGKMVDKSFDSGDDSDFVLKWFSGQSKEININELNL
jgi:high-affinity nickel permease